MSEKYVAAIDSGTTSVRCMIFNREGRVVDSGPVEDVVTAESLSETFAMPLLLSRSDDRFAARRRPAERVAPA